MASLIALSAWEAAALCNLRNTDRPACMTSLQEAYDNVEQTAAADEDEELPPYERELTLYLRESRLPWSTNIYAFWHWNQYACSTPAAQKYLSALPTSVAS